MHPPKKRNGSGEMLTISQICELVNLGETKVRELVKESNSSIKIGRALRVNKNKFLEYLEKTYSL